MRKITTHYQKLQKTLLASCMITAATAGYVHAQTPDSVPIPYLRPFASTVSPSVPAPLLKPDATTTASIPRTPSPVQSLSVQQGNLKAGLDAAAKQDLGRALAIHKTMSNDSLDQHILSWALALSNGSSFTSSQMIAASNQLRGWPGMSSIRDNIERALYRENPPSNVVLDFFSKQKPQTAQGMTVLARAYLSRGQQSQARQLLAPWWATAKLNSDDEALILKQFSGVLTKDDHLQRLYAMLYANRIQSAGRVAALAEAQSLYRGVAAVAKGAPDATQQLAAVHSSWKSSPVYLFAQIQHLRRNEYYSKAAELMLKAPRDAKTLVDPDAWWVERRVLSRELLDIGKPKIAYQLAAAHSAESPVMAADAEFHAGWYALRSLNDPATAHKHFSRIAQLSSRPITASRAYYWLGRTAEAGKTNKAAQFYQRASNYGTAFYGQLAAAKLGRSALQLPYPRPTEQDRQRFEQREPVQAIRRLEAIGYNTRAQSLYIALARELTSVGELAMLAVMAERNNNHYIALRVGKIAAGRGLDVGALSHPIGAIPANANIKGSGAALAYAIARQESEFNSAAVSSAGARGLLQLMPATAKNVAQRSGMSYSQQRLTTDAAYNATLGAHYLGEQIDRFNGSYILTFAGYNAGPTRANEWINKYGDPRNQNIDQVVDWIERIPYTETRNYVQRVMENYQVYKSRLYGKVTIQQDLINGRR